MADDALIKDIGSKIERERKLIEGYTHLRQSSSNPQVQNSTDVQIRDARRNIAYFESKLSELRARNGYPQQQRGPQGPSSGRIPYGPNDVGGPDYGTDNYSDLSNPNRAPPRGPFAPGAPGSQQLKQRPNYSRLDLIKDDSPHLGPRIQLMLSQLQFKLNVERQYKDGTEKLMSVYGHMEGDRKTKADAEAKRVESVHKIQLMSQALKRYEDLHLDMDTSDGPDDDSVNGPTLRRPLTGLLAMRIHRISDVNHAITGRFSRGPETFVILKVEDETKGKTRATRNDEWSNEYLEIGIDKGNEIELIVYDKVSGDYPRPIGLLWIPIADIAEEMRRKKIEHDFNQAGWVSADKMENGGGAPGMQFSPPPGSQPRPNPAGPGGAPGAEAGPGAIKAWFSLEPMGRIELSLHFTKQTRERQPFDVTAGGIQRKGAIRQRKEDVHELYGHKFVMQSFYNIMRCAFCGELCKNGMQCSDCKYMCHEKCYPKVVTKCISKSNAESDPEEPKLQHRIPHRFEPFGNIAAKWCCHCGYMLPFGRKQPRMCRECKLTAHAHCTHLVPDFCGMSMETASEALRVITGMKEMRAKPMQKTLRPPKPSRPGVSPSDSQVSQLSQTSTMDSSSRDRLSYTKEGDDMPPPGPQSRPSLVSTPSTPASPYAPPKQEIHKRPVPNRTGSEAAQAAAVALQQKNQSSPTDPRPYPIRTSSGQPTSPSVKQGPPPPQHAAYDPGAYASYDRGYTSTPTQMQSPYQIQAQPAPQAQPQPQPLSQPPPQSTPQPSKPAEPSRQSVVAAKAPVPEPAPAQPVATQKQTPSKRPPRVGLDHFNFLAVLGKGNFGKVMLAETKATKQLYAIKVLKKEFIIENDEVESTRSERDVFIIANKARHPFLLNLHACFQTETRVYFVMEYISGGDLMLHIQRGQFGTKRAQFYAAEVCLALKYFHENGVVYRDLKLDNILLTLDGHIKIADYGLCKMNMHYGSSTSTFCGTPEFMAPEILLDKKYGRAVDWWAFGVLIYQMLLQQSPFRGEDEDEIYDAILADEPLYPIHMPRDSVSILQKLLTREPEMRLGSGPTDAQEIMSHAFFRNINWDDIQNKRIPAPFLPQIRSATDTSNFDQEFTSVTPVLTPVQSVLSQADQEEFRGFSYSADFV